MTVAIGGACSGCGIAPMTMNAIEKRLPERVDQVPAGRFAAWADSARPF